MLALSASPLCALIFTAASMMVYQVWRPLRGPVEDSPLALVDARSVKPDDLMENRIDFPERTGYTYSVKHNPGICSSQRSVSVQVGMQMHVFRFI